MFLKLNFELLNKMFKKYIHNLRETNLKEVQVFLVSRILPILIIAACSIGYSILFSQAWVLEHIGKDSYEFVGNLHTTGYANNKALNYTINYTTHFAEIDEFDIQIQEYKKESYILLYLIIIAFLTIMLWTIFSVFKKKIIETIDKDYENSLMSVIGGFLGISFGLSTGSYLLLISLRKDYLNQLFLLVIQKVPYENLPFIKWDATYQILCISYIGFAIISILLLIGLLLRIVFIKYNYHELKHSSNSFFIAAFLLSIQIVRIFSSLDEFW